jgi:histidinol-phosphate aminotransferase
MRNIQARPVRDLRNRYAEIESLLENHDPVIITKNGRGTAVLVNIEDYAKLEEYQHILYMEEKLREAEQEDASPQAVRQNHKDVFRRLKRNYRSIAAMSAYWNTRVQGLEPYIPGEQPRDRAFIKLNTNENPYPPSPKVAEAIEALLAQGAERLRLYPDPSCAELREAAAALYGVKPEQVFAGNGSDEVLAFAFGAFFNSDPAAPLLFPDITYSFYPVYAGLWDIPFRAVPVGDDFSVNSGDYLAPAGTVGGAIFPNPNAPTGLALPLTEILRVASHLEQQRRLLIVDEAYAAFGAESAAAAAAARPNLLTVHTLSKSASLAGLRVGFAIGNEELVEGLRRIRDSFNSYTVDRLAQAAAVAALGDAAYYGETTQKVIAARERTAAALTAAGYRVIPSRANFLFIRSPKKSGPELFAALRERGILVRHFNKPRIADFLRVSVGTDADMDAFLAACEEIEKLRG